MARTYLQLVNDVLTNLREANVTSVQNAPVYPALIAAYVNKAKEKVEDAWRWRCLTVAANITTVTGQDYYPVDNSGTGVTWTPGGNSRYITDRAYLVRDSEGIAQVIATLTGSVVLRLTEWDYEDLIWNKRAVIVQVNQPPYGFGFTLLGGVPNIVLARPADNAYNVEARFINPQVPLSADTDNMIVPYQPVVSYATSLAMQERGEELGTQADLYMALHNDELARAITQDGEQFTLQLKND